MRGPPCHQGIAEGARPSACPGEVQGAFGVVCCGKCAYFGISPPVAELEEYGVAECTLMHLRAKPAESIRQLVVLSGSMDHYREDIMVDS